MRQYLNAFFLFGGLSIFSGLSPIAQAQNPNWVPVPELTIVSIYDFKKKEADTLHIFALDQSNARKRCGGQGSPLVIFTNHGIPVTGMYAPFEQPSGFVEVYYDADGDHQPDTDKDGRTRTVLALDLSTQTNAWITWRAGDQPGIVYLHPSAQIAVAGGIDHQTVYRPTNKQDSDVLSCDMGRVSKPGGKHHIGAYQMTPRWN